MVQQNAELMKKVVRLIEENMQHPNCLVKVEAVILTDYPDYYAMFTQEMGLTPNEYLTKQRLNYAEKLLEQKDLSLKDISKAIGLNGYFEFTQLFKRYNGMSPTSYRIQLFKAM